MPESTTRRRTVGNELAVYACLVKWVLGAPEAVQAAAHSPLSATQRAVLPEVLTQGAACHTALGAVRSCGAMCPRVSCLTHACGYTIRTTHTSCRRPRGRGAGLRRR